MPIKFIHTGDWHLGQRMHYAGEPKKYIKTALDEAPTKAIENIINLAINEQVDFVIIAGDIYNTATRSIKANQFFCQQCEKLKQHNIKVFAIAGNHDPMGMSQELFALPNNVYQLKADKNDVVEYKKNGQIAAILTGQSYNLRHHSEKMHLNYSVSDFLSPVIGVLHTQLGATESDYVPSTISELKQQNNINYWALGHVHQQSIEHVDQPTIAYCGTPQGCDFGELGLGGVLLVEMESKKVKNITPKQTGLVRIIEKHVSLTGELIESITDLENLLINKAQESLKSATTEKGQLMRWVITGQSTLKDKIKDKEEVEFCQSLLQRLNKATENTQPFIYHNAIQLHLSSVIDYEQLKQEEPIYQRIENIEQEIKNQGMSDTMLKVMGEVWKTNLNVEDEKGKFLELDDSLFNDILNDASRLLMDTLAEKRMQDED